MQKLLSCSLDNDANVWRYIRGFLEHRNDVLKSLTTFAYGHVGYCMDTEYRTILCHSIVFGRASLASSLGARMLLRRGALQLIDWPHADSRDIPACRSEICGVACALD